MLLEKNTVKKRQVNNFCGGSKGNKRQILTSLKIKIKGELDVNGSEFGNIQLTADRRWRDIGHG